LNICNYQSCTY